MSGGTPHFFTLYIGVLTWGGFGTPVSETPALIPVNDWVGENSMANYDVCDYTERKLLKNPNNGHGPGNFGCEGCSGSAQPDGWDIVEVKTTTDSDAYSINPPNGGLIISRDGDDYRVEDGDGNEMGRCRRTNDSDNKSCTVGSSDHYNMNRYLLCEMNDHLQWS